MTDCLSWSCPLPCSLLALEIDAQGQDGADAALPQLCAALRDLPALQHLDFSMEDLSSQLPLLLTAIGVCPLTHLALRWCGLSHLTWPSHGTQFCQTLQVIDLSGNPSLREDAWLPFLASLPQCHSVNLSTRSGRLYVLAEAWAVLFASTALKFVMCDELEITPALVDRRALQDLSPIDICMRTTHPAWDSYRAIFNVPVISPNPLAVLHQPQLDGTSCWQPGGSARTSSYDYKSTV